MLHSVKDCPKGRTKWCGPTALAALTGIGYMDAIAVLKSVRLTRGVRNPIIKGTSNTAMLSALGKLGFIVMPVRIQRKEHAETFAAFLRRREGALSTTPMLINVTNHYLAVCGRKGIESKTAGGEPIFISKLGSRRARMDKAWTVRPAKPGHEMRALRTAVVAAAHAHVARASIENRENVARQDDIDDILHEAKRVGLKVTIYSDKTGCIIRPPGDRPFNFGVTNVYRGHGWSHYAYEFCRDFEEDCDLDWEWERPREVA